MEQKLAKQVKHKVTDVESFQDYSKDLMMHSKDKFNNIFNSMNNYKKEEKHVDLHEEKAKLKGGHEIHEGDHRPFNYDVRKQHHTQGNQGVENVQHESDVHLDNAVIKNIKPAHIEKDRRPIDKTALMTDVEKHHHHHHAKPKEEVKLQKAQDLVDATKAKSHNSTSNAKLDELIKKHVNCPKCKDCPTCQCAAQSISPLEELATHSNELTFQSADEKPEDIRLQILPQDLRDYVTKEVQVLNSERIVGYNTYSNILEQEQGQKKDISIDSNSDFYNVTVNFIMKRKQSGQKGNQGPKELPISLYENSINEVERHQQKQAQEKADQQAEEESEPKVIMPNELTLPKKESNDKSVHQILQESRVTKEEDQIATMIQEQVDALGPSDLEEQSELVSLDSSVTNLEEQKLRNTLKNLPIELNNAQIADQLRNLTPKEAMQMFQESQKMGNRPANVINLQLSEESVPASQNATISASQVKSEGGVDSQEISKLDAMMKNETHRIEQSFTDYIIPENEKNMVASIFS